MLPTFEINTEADTHALGANIAKAIMPPFTLFLQGDLGVGKTTLTRAILNALGHTGRVKSPSYTLVEPYHIGNLTLYHLDLYRLNSPLELENLGIRDYLAQNAIRIVEWPEKAGGLLPNPDILCEMTLEANQRTIKVKPFSAAGETLIKNLQA